MEGRKEERKEGEEWGWGKNERGNGGEEEIRRKGMKGGRNEG
jgi:hypothetical protein